MSWVKHRTSREDVYSLVACTFNSVQRWLPFCFLSCCPLSDNSKEAHRSPAGKYSHGIVLCW